MNGEKLRAEFSSALDEGVKATHSEAIPEFVFANVRETEIGEKMRRKTENAAVAAAAMVHSRFDNLRHHHNEKPPSAAAPRESLCWLARIGWNLKMIFTESRWTNRHFLVAIGGCTLVYNHKDEGVHL